MKIIVDAFGGDNAPIEVLKGCILALEKNAKQKIILVGNRQKIENVASKNNISLRNIDIHDATSIIDMCDDPLEIVESKNNSSMAEGLRFLNNEPKSSFVCAGNSGALAIGATLITKRIEGIRRCAFATILPSTNGLFMLLDSGMNVKCKPDMLFQFAIMGSVYVEKIIGKKSPRVGLLNLGTERTKGDTLRKDTYKLLKTSHLNFIGNIESRDIPIGNADVIVTDGFTGNIVLKLYEGMGNFILPEINNEFSKFKITKYQLNYSKCGAAPILGSTKPIFKVHGNAKAEIFKNAILFASDCTEKNLIDAIEKEIKNNIIL